MSKTRDQWTISKTSDRVQQVSKLVDLDMVSFTKWFDKMVQKEIEQKKQAEERDNKPVKNTKSKNHESKRSRKSLSY